MRLIQNSPSRGQAKFPLSGTSKISPIGDKQNSLFYVFCILLITGCTLITGCSVYSLKSGSIPPDIRSISIQNFINEGGGPSSMSQNLTEKLKSYYQQNSRLIVVKTDGDWQLEGRITSYSVTPVAPSAVAGQTGSSNLNRLTITVGVKFVNTKNVKENFETPFSFFSDYQQGQNLTQVEGDLVEIILNQIVIDIFNKTTSNW